MSDMVITGLGDSDDDQALTRADIRRWRDLCRYCGRRLPLLRISFCTGHCRDLWEKSRPRAVTDTRPL